MPVTDPMFPGDIHDSAARVAADLAARLDRDDSAETRRKVTETAADMGWPIAALPEDRGGLGLGYAGLIAIAEAAGAEGGPLALAGPACAAVELSALCPADVRIRLDIAIAEGRIVTAALGTMVGDQIGPRGLSLARSGDTVTLSGHLAGIDGITAPDHLLIALPDGDGAALVEVTAQTGARFETRPRMDTRPALAVIFDAETRLTPIARLSAQDIAAIEARCALVTAAEAIGAAGRALDLTIAFLNEREQFGVALSTFQVLRHKAVDAFVECMVSRGAVIEVVRALDQGFADEAEIALASLQTRAAAKLIGKEVVQLHGGIGMTDVLPAARLARRLLMLDFEYGSSARILRDLSGHAA